MKFRVSSKIKMYVLLIVKNIVRDMNIAEKSTPYCVFFSVLSKTNYNVSSYVIFK